MKNEKLLLYTLAALQFTHVMDFIIMMPLGPQLMRIFQISPQQFSLLVSSYTITAGVFGFFAAFFVDRYDRKAFLRLIYAGFVLGTFACALAPGYTALLLARAITGAFGGAISAMLFSIVGDLIPLERRAGAMGIVTAGFSVASVLGVPFGLFMAAQYSWHAPFYLLGGLGLGVSLLMEWAIPTMKGHLQQSGPAISPLQVLANIANNKNQLLALLFVMLLMMGNFTVIPFISPYMVANVGFSEAQLTYIYLFGGGFTIFTSPLVGRLADRYGHQQLFAFFVLFYTIPLLGVTNLPPVALPVALAFTSLFFVCGGGRMIPAMTMITGTVQPQNRGSFMSITSSVQQLSTGVASFIGGLIVQKNAEGQLVNYPYVGGIAVLAGLLALWVSRKLVVSH